MTITTTPKKQEYKGQQNLHSPSTSSSNNNSPFIPTEKYSFSDDSTHQYYVDLTSSSKIIESNSYPEKKEGTNSSSSHAVAKDSATHDHFNYANDEYPDGDTTLFFPRESPTMNVK